MYALDSSFLISYSNGNLPAMIWFRKTIERGIPMVIPSIVDFEVMRGFYHTRSRLKEANYEIIRGRYPVIEINANIWDCAAKIWARLRKAGRTIGDADILIAAYCIENNYTLITSNTKHFVDIDNLLLEGWGN